MLFWIALFVAIVPIVALNIVTIKTIMHSNIHSKTSKHKLCFIVWGIPVFGVMLAMFKINQDIKQLNAQSEDKLADALKNFTDSITAIEVSLHSKQKKTPLH